MKLLHRLALVVLVLGVVGFVGSFVVPASLASKAELIQRMQPYDALTAELTGESGTPIGSPQLMVIDDPAAFLPGKGEEGARLVNDDYLKAEGIYPLQVKTIDFVAGLVRLGTGAAALVGLAGFLWTRKRLQAVPA